MASELDKKEDKISLNDLLIDESKKNKRKIRCKYCNSLILLESIGVYIESVTQIPMIESKTGCDNCEELKDFWLIDDMMKFENIGFTNDVKDRKYLICADCEIGPLGFQNIEDKNKLFLAINRVKHVD